MKPHQSVSLWNPSKFSLIARLGTTECVIFTIAAVFCGIAGFLDIDLKCYIVRSWVLGALTFRAKQEFPLDFFWNGRYPSRFFAVADDRYPIWPKDGTTQDCGTCSRY